MVNLQLAHQNNMLCRNAVLSASCSHALQVAPSAVVFVTNYLGSTYYALPLVFVGPAGNSRHKLQKTNDKVVRVMQTKGTLHLEQASNPHSNASILTTMTSRFPDAIIIYMPIRLPESLTERFST